MPTNLPRLRGTRPLVIAVATALAFTACTSPDSSSDPDGAPTDAASTEESSAALTATTADVGETVVLQGESPDTLAVAASQTLFTNAPVVVVAADGEQLRAASAAAALGVPVLLDGPDVANEVERLGAEVALALGPISDPGIDVIVPEDDATLAELVGASNPDDTDPVPDGGNIAALMDMDADSPQLLITDATTAEPSATDASSTPSSATAPDATPLESDRDELPAIQRPAVAEGVVVMTTGDDRDTLAVGTALASGAEVMVVPGGDPRATSDTVQALAEAQPSAAVGIGPEFVDAATLTGRLQVAATGVELPGGGQLVLPGKTYVALYGHPGAPVLGVLGEQDAQATVERAAAVASEYDSLTEQPVVPAMEIIATVASAEAGPDGNYSNEVAVETLRPFVDLAGENGQYVVLDLQPGRTDFVTQAKLYEELLTLPHVGLALDPEWRLLPNEVHLRQIGHVEVAEVNEVVTWLADLTRENELPQKMLILHQFQVQMLRDVNQVDQSRPEVAVLIHVDGQGPQPTKQETWRTLHDNATSVNYWGWKNFYDEDIPGPLSPADTMSEVDPVPDFISYQ